jgi:hypothetical protein
MNETVISVLSILSILTAIPALTVACVALAYVIGLKNSTHQVVWKPVDPAEADPFTAQAEEEEETEEFKPYENPNKRIKPAAEEDFADLSDPSVTSNDWQ